MTIAHIGPAALPVGYSFGGAVERRMVELAAAQLHRGDDVLVVSLAAEGDELCSEGPRGRSRFLTSPAAPGEASKFTWSAIADRAEKLYREVLT